MTLAPLIEGFEHRNTVGGITETRKRTTWVKKGLVRLFSGKSASMQRRKVFENLRSAIQLDRI